MSLLLDSEAQFASRAKEVGLSATVIQNLKDVGVNHLSALAFAVGQPGQAISVTDVDTFLQNAMGRPPILAENTAIRRLAFEAQTLITASLRQIVEARDDDGTPKKIGAAERETRMAAIRAELGGLCISDDNEPSHLLLEKACQIGETNALKYLEPSSCTSRSQEVQGSSKTKELSFEGGSLVIKDKDDKLIAPTSSEMQFLFAMNRRGVAYKFARLMTFEQHSTWANFLIQAMQREPPPGYAKPSLHQIMLCDKAAFTRLASTLSSVRQAPDGSFPLGLGLLELRSDPTIALHLVPLARQVAPQASTGRRTGPYGGGGKAQQQNVPDRKGRGKGKQGKTPPMPAELRNKWHRTSSEPLSASLTTQPKAATKHVMESSAKRDGTFAQSRAAYKRTLCRTTPRSLDGVRKTGAGLLSISVS